MQDIREQKYLLPYKPHASQHDSALGQGKYHEPDIYTRAELIRCCKAISYGRHFEESSRRAECDGAVQDACLDARSIELQNWYEHMIGNFATGYDRRMLPNRWDGGSMFGMRVWENEGRVPIDEAMFYGFVGNNMSALLQENIRNMMCQLAALVFWEYDWSLVSDPRLNLMDVNVGYAATLALPDALFVCKECGARGLPWPEIHGHWRERHPEQSFWRKKWVGTLGEQPKVQLWKAGREVAGTILDKLGLWIGMERVGLDALMRIGRLYCACGDLELALPEDLTWAGLVHHVWIHWEMSRVRKLPQHDLIRKEGSIRNHVHSDYVILLLVDADTAPASYRRRADSDTRIKIQAALSEPGHLKDSSVICFICDKLLDENDDGLRKDVRLIISRSVDAIAYHMESQHGRPFSDGNISFYSFPGRKALRL